MEVRCKHCCKFLFKGDDILFNAHHEVKQQVTDVGCEAELDYCSYMIPENVPDWIMDTINQVHLPYQDLKITQVYMCMKYEFK